MYKTTLSARKTVALQERSRGSSEVFYYLSAAEI
jgi:hypothetical protein